MVAFLHQHTIIHADIKPENILLSATTNSYHLKLADFGLSQYETGQDKSLDVQTFWYRAPEIWNRTRRYTSAVDMWSVGLILRELLTGHPLSSSRNERGYFAVVKTILGEVPDATTSLASLQAKSDWSVSEWNEYTRLINGCLSYDPATRLTADNILTSFLFSDYTIPTGSSYIEEVLSPSLTSTLAQQLQKWVPSNTIYHKSVLPLALKLSSRAIGTLPSAEERELALASLNIALKIIQRTSLPSRSFPELMGRRSFSIGEMWNAEARLVQLLGFRLYVV